MTSSSLFWPRHTCAREDAQVVLPEDVPTSRCSCSEGVSDTLNDSCHSGPRKADGGDKDDARNPASPQRSRCTACMSVPGPSAQVRLALPSGVEGSWSSVSEVHGGRIIGDRSHVDGEKSVTARHGPLPSGLAGGLVPDRETDREREHTQDRSVVAQERQEEAHAKDGTCNSTLTGRLQQRRKRACVSDACIRRQSTDLHWPENSNTSRLFVFCGVTKQPAQPASLTISRVVLGPSIMP